MNKHQWSNTLSRQLLNVHRVDEKGVTSPPMGSYSVVISRRSNVINRGVCCVLAGLSAKKPFLLRQVAGHQVPIPPQLLGQLEVAIWSKATILLRGLNLRIIVITTTSPSHVATARTGGQHHVVPSTCCVPRGARRASGEHNRRSHYQQPGTYTTLAQGPTRHTWTLLTW